MSPELLLLRNCTDFGMVVLLWLVQLVIYPSFLTTATASLVDWHRSYTFRVSFVIMPLMLLQLGTVGWMAFRRGTTADWLSLALVLGCWLLTFAVSVPLHRRIDRGEGGRATLRRLILTNWPRTGLWTVVFLLGLGR